MSEQLSVVPHQPPSLARAVASPKEIIERHKELTAIINETFTPEVDFGVIPGTKKPTLLKPGAERLCIAFGSAPHYELVQSEVDHNFSFTWEKWQTSWNGGRKERSLVSGTSTGLYRYIYKCRIVRYDGRNLGEGEGSCSTLENKYCDRPRDLENTVIKMAQKRALIAATLNAFGISDRFTQDMEESDHGHQPSQRPAPTQDPETFNARDKDHLAWFKAQGAIGMLDEVDAKKVALELHGKPRNQLEACIKKVEMAFVDHQRTVDAPSN